MSSALMRARTGEVTGMRRQILIATTDEIPKREVVEVFGLVRGNTIRARHLGRDISAMLKNLVGGEIRDYTKLMGESREQALDRMAEQAIDLGADAVVGVRFTTSMLMGGAAELLAYGTAVKLAEP